MDMMHTYLELYLQAQKASKQTIRGWNKVWTSAKANPSEPLPCPECYMQGRIARLVTLPAEDGKARASCKVCRKTFAWPEG